MGRIACIGMITLDFLHVLQEYPKEDTENQVLQSLLAVGGPTGRAAVTCARLGAVTTAAGMIGRGIYADMLQTELSKEPLDVQFVTERQSEISQHSFILISGAGKYRTTFWTPQPKANEELIELSKEIIRQSDCVVLDCTEEKLSLEAAQTASGLGVPTIIDTGSYKPFVETILPFVDHIVSPEKFFQKRADAKGETFEDQMRIILDQCKAKSVVMTRGEKGGRFLTPAMLSPVPYPALTVEAVDTCGAGDTFHGAFAYGLMQNWPIEDVVLFSSWVAGRKCAALGNVSLPIQSDLSSWRSEISW